ncbi:MAG: hypothetical protein ACR2G6_04195 [Gemmatimonadaceae bacterium]
MIGESRQPVRENLTRRIAKLTLVLGTCAIAIGYASAFMKGGAPSWAAWFLAFGIPATLAGIMVMGASREGGGVGKLAAPFGFVTLVLAAGFCLALALPASERPSSQLFLGLPLRAAIILYGVGLLPIIVLPIAYALTFDTQTLNSEDVDRVRRLGAEFAKSEKERNEAPEPAGETRE